MSGWTDLLRSGAELNLRYASALMDLSRGYLRDVTEIVRREPAAAPAPATPAAPVARPPLLLAGRAGELANAAYAISNPTDREMPVQLQLQGGPAGVRVEPERFTLAPGGSAVVRVLAPVDAAWPVDKDQVGHVVAPGLSAPAVPFVVRRLADA